jgi:hypothetical protein
MHLTGCSALSTNGLLQVAFTDGQGEEFLGKQEVKVCFPLLESLAKGRQY